MSDNSENFLIVKIDWHCFPANYSAKKKMKIEKSVPNYKKKKCKLLSIKYKFKHNDCLSKVNNEILNYYNNTYLNFMFVYI